MNGFGDAALHRNSLAVACDYNVIMKATLIQIGNSRGVRIPKAVLEQTGLRDT